ncbi:MAG TPA: alkaline phosphatase family protein [Vicinamibacterales bacterium]|jgi:predicted AlkP superfamily pyrophosphatase or phosphodiesterase|nr:alkaline phosphatase family protein [Vicinamibacterales bacterium]
MKRIVSIAAAITAVTLGASPHPAAQAARGPRAQEANPKLVVLIAVDQMRGDYPVRYASLMSKGIKRLTTEGAWFKEAAYPYLNTYTCVGHNTIGTGTLPYQHGMMQNVWFDRQTQKTVTCTSDATVTDITTTGPATGVGDSAVRNMQPALADVMRRDLHSRVVTMSMKARAAIGLAGHGGDAVIWLDERGALETSSAFGSVMPAWAMAFAKANPSSGYSDKVWEPMFPPDRYQYTDTPPGEKPGNGWSAPFPHALGNSADRSFFAHFEGSPFGDEYLEQMAEYAVDQMKLGQQDTTDVLGISFSSLDVVGHTFGPRSHEVQDLLAHLDITIGKLLDHLDTTVGKGNYVLGLSADHGVADVPEQVEGGLRVMPPTVTAAIETALKPLLGDGPFVDSNLGNDLYFKPGVYEKVSANPRALAAIRTAVLGVPGMARVITKSEVEQPGTRTSKDAILRAAALSYYPGRSGDLMLVTKPNVIYGTTTTTHGSPYYYDQHVPVILFGHGIKAVASTASATPADLAATIAPIVGVKLPSPDGRVLTAALSAVPARNAGKSRN